MHKTINQLNEDDIDLKKLDRLAESNFTAKDRQYSVMCNVIRKAGNFYSFVTEPKIASLASRLQERNIGAYELDMAMDRVVDHYEKFPGYKAIYELCVTYKKHGKSAYEETPEDRYNAQEAIEYEKIRATWCEHMGEDRLHTYVKWWLKQCYGLDSDNLETLSIAISAFERPALFDWYDAGTVTSPDKIEAVFRKKEQKQLRRKNNSINKEYIRVKP